MQQSSPEDSFLKFSERSHLAGAALSLIIGSSLLIFLLQEMPSIESNYLNSDKNILGLALMKSALICITATQFFHSALLLWTRKLILSRKNFNRVTTLTAVNVLAGPHGLLIFLHWIIKGCNAQTKAKFS